MKKFYPWLALLLSAWFQLFSWFWTYGGALIIAYPAGILGFFFWRAADKNLIRRLAGWFLVWGIALSIVSLVLILIYN